MSQPAQPSASSSKVPAQGKLFGKYELVEQLGRGGMAEVWKAKIRGIAGFERTLVIKRVLPQLVRDEEFVAMFVREAQLCSMLSHANIVQVFELGELEGEYYLAMEYVRGRDLHAVMRARPKEPPPPGLAAIVGRDVCRALAYAHALRDDAGKPLRLIHRDVTPSNVMISVDGAVKLVDFGVAKALAMASASLTSAGSIKGKLSYMSPEQIMGADIDHRTDLFAVGITIHETLTGRRLFKGEDDEETVERVLSSTVYAPSQINPNVPKELDAVVMRALERDPNRRWQSGEELADALEASVHQLKWGPAQLTATLRERFPEIEVSAPSAARVHAVAAPVLQESQITPTPTPKSAAPPMPTPTPTPNSQFADLPTEFAPPSFGMTGPASVSSNTTGERLQLPTDQMPAVPEPTRSTTNPDVRQYRPTLPLIRAIDQQGQWTEDEARKPVDPGPTMIQGMTPSVPPRPPGRKSEELETIPMQKLVLAKTEIAPAGGTPPKATPLPSGPTVAMARLPGVPQAPLAPLPSAPTVARSATPLPPQQTRATTMPPLSGRSGQTAENPIPRGSVGLRLALVASALLFGAAGITFLVRSQRQPAVESLPVEPAPVAPAIAAPTADTPPKKADPAEDLRLLAPKDPTLDDVAISPTRGARPITDDELAPTRGSNRKHRSRAEKRAAPIGNADDLPKTPPKSPGRRSRAGDIERGDVVDPF